jgi:hypothetical protein
VSRVVHLVADHGAGDPALAELVESLTLVLPDSVVHHTAVARSDTLAAGIQVARLALEDDPGERVVLHDVGPRGDEAEAWPGDDGERFCAGRGRPGVLVVGPNTGWSWSFVVDELRGLCYLDVPARGPGLRSPQLVAEAVAHAVAGHTHANCGSVPRARVPRAPERVATSLDPRAARPITSG